MFPGTQSESALQYPPNWQIRWLDDGEETGFGTGLGTGVLTGLGTGLGTGVLTGLGTGLGTGTELMVGVDPYPDGFRQFGAFGCKHCLLLQVAPGSQQSNAELQLLPLFAMQPVEELRYVDESGIH